MAAKSALYVLQFLKLTCHSKLFPSRWFSSFMKRFLLCILVVVLYVLHQDIWFWRTARPLLFGFLPIGIWYHLGFTIAVSLVMWLLIKQAWPAHLEEDFENEEKIDVSQSSDTSATGEGETH